MQTEEQQIFQAQANPAQEQIDVSFEELFGIMRERWPIPSYEEGQTVCSSSFSMSTETDSVTTSWAPPQSTDNFEEYFVPDFTESMIPTAAPCFFNHKRNVADPFDTNSKRSRQHETEATLVPLDVKEAVVPSQVAMAFSVLDLPLTASVDDVKRQGRRLARSRHPDKAEPANRARAARLFRQLQEAKDLLLAWLQERGSIQADENSVGSSPYQSDAEGDDNGRVSPQVGEVGDVTGEFQDDGSGSEGEREILQACNIAVGRGDSVSDSDSDARSVDQAQHGGIVAAASSFIRSEDSCLVQASTLSHFQAAQRSQKQKLCDECFQRTVPPGDGICKKCRAELNKLRRCLVRTVHQ